MNSIFSRRRVVVFLLVMLLFGIAAALAVGPAVRWVVRSRMVPRAEQALGVTVDVGEIEVGFGSVTLRDVRVKTAADLADAPLAALPTVRLRIGIGQLLWGSGAPVAVDVIAPRVTLVRHSNGEDNIRAILRRLRTPQPPAGAPDATGRRGRSLLKQLRVTAGQLRVVEQRYGLSLEVPQVNMTITPAGDATVKLSDLRLTTRWRVISAAVDELALVGRLAGGAPLPPLSLSGGVLQLLPQFRLSGIDGTVAADLAGDAPRMDVDFQGSYGGASAKLWSATGWVAPTTGNAAIRATADQFRLGRIAEVLTRSPVIDPDQTTVAGHLVLGFADQQLHVTGELKVDDLNLFHPRVARVAIPELSATVTTDLRFHVGHGDLVIEQMDFRYEEIDAQLRGEIRQLYAQPSGSLQLVVPAVPCQQILDALPDALVPELRGFALKGTFAMDMEVTIDTQDLAAARIGGRVGINRCQVREAPEDLRYEQFSEPFTHTVEASPGVFARFVVGPENPDFVLFSDVSPHVINALISTEDPSFFRHRGFVPSQFSEALARNLQRGGFRLGASTITMQLVKNVLLSHEKTISRKLQELFLTWYLEGGLAKERMMEIYLNVIEFGPGLFGVGAATRHYFGKTPYEVTPIEAAFLTSLLPSPRRRYAEYCQGVLSAKWKKQVLKILARMYARGRLLEEEYARAKETNVAFVRDKREFPTAICLERVEETAEAWRAEYYRRLAEAVLAAAPHQLAQYVPEEFRDDAFVDAAAGGDAR